MSKPRVWECYEFHTALEVRRMISGERRNEGDKIIVIEKSVADKLADALEKYKGIKIVNFGGDDVDFAEQALKDYRCDDE